MSDAIRYPFRPCARSARVHPLSVRFLPCCAVLMMVLGTLSCSGDDESADQASTRGEHASGPSSPGTQSGLQSAEGDADTGADTGAGANVREIPLLSEARISSRPGAEDFQRARAPMAVPSGTWADASLLVELDTTCYPFEKWQDDPPPAGQNWPASCDAFDRNFEVLLRDVSREEPAFEVERAITPFGGPMTLDVDVTDLLNARDGEWELEVFIATWSDGEGRVTGSDGGWNVSARLILEAGDAPRPVVGALPLFDAALNFGEPVAQLAWSAPEEARGARLELRMTGHGGAQGGGNACIGPAEEFCRRRVDLLLNGSIFSSFEPWRDDCEAGCTDATRSDGFVYCAENPTGQPASVRAPRANWCPGARTSPEVFEGAALLGEDNLLEISVPGLIEGGNWRTSAVLYFFE